MLDHVLDKIQALQKNYPVFQGIKRGIERETLRVNRQGELARTHHSKKLGSKLTHPHITTDYSENLLELITSPFENIDDLIGQLHDIHTYTINSNPDEYFWPLSMPCWLGSDAEIPIADYGTSNSGQMKMHYRRGLGHRYGRHMQTIAGMHYNFSLPASFWEYWYSEINQNFDSLRSCVDHYYMALIRNYLRVSWFTYYLFGASPAAHASFFTHKPAEYLENYNNQFYTTPQAIALRMSDIGYQSKVQDSMSVSYNSLDEYSRDLKKATETSLHSYENITQQFGKNAQLNTSILQIEAEFYSAIRPKQTFCPGQRPVFTLKAKGIEYIEVRNIDINPYQPLGINQQQILLLDTLLVYCVLQESPAFTKNEANMLHQNQIDTVLHGRDPNCMLQKGNEKIKLVDWANELFTNLEKVAVMLDENQSGKQHSEAIAFYKQQLAQPSTILSAKYMNELKNNGSYIDHGNKLAQQHHKYFMENRLSKDKQQMFVEMAKDSLAKQKVMEQNDSVSYEEYVRRYYEVYCAPSDC